MQLRIAWGGGAERAWRGTLSLSEGSLAEPRALGLEIDEPGSIRLDGRLLRILERAPRNYDGVDVSLHAPLSARLKIELAAADDTRPATPIEVALSDLITGQHNVKLDDRGNRLLVRRAPGDNLRVEFDRPSLVFAPREKFRLDVVPHLVDIAAGSAVQFRAQLAVARGGEEVWSTDRDLRVAGDGSVGPLSPLEIEVPAGEGVYDLRLSLTKWQIRAPFLPAQPTHVRKVQLVVIDPAPPAAERAPPEAWKTLLDIDPTASHWWDRFVSIPQLKVIPGWGQGPLGNDRARAADVQGRKFMRLDVDGWQAYPLPIDRPNVPHILEIEYPAGETQTLGISIIEPNEAGVAGPLGLDSGFDVSEPSSTGNTQVHRLVFWPRTKVPLVLLANRRGGRQAYFGRIRVVAGPERLASAAESPAANAASLHSTRLIAAYFDRPLFPENFMAGESLDPGTGRTVDDWLTFYDGARRMIEYLKHAGYNGAVISVASDGSAIYPSRLLDPTPRFDSGTYAASGQDPIRKDVLEMLLRMFDREGLRFVPAVQFVAPLPALESGRQQADSTGLAWVDGEGRTWIERNGTLRGAAPYYNVLDDRVQQAMLDVASELAARCANHPSFAGLALQLTPDGYAQLPGSEWGLDERTIARFAAETNLPLPVEDGLGRRRPAWVGQERRKEWLAWRAGELAKFYQRVHAVAASVQPAARLYVTGAELARSPHVQRVMRPALPRRTNFADGMLELGIDAELYRDKPGIVLVEPNRVAPLAPLAAQAVNLEITQSPEVNRYYAGAAAATQFFHESQQLRLPSFDAVAPFGKDRTSTALLSHIAPAGEQNRRRFVHALATLDAQVILEGGWMLPLGQEDALRPIFDVYRRLPNGRFRTAGEDPRQPLPQAHPAVIRTLVHEGRTYVYVVNDSPWPVTLDVALDVPPTARLDGLGTLRPVAPLVRRDGAAWWNVTLEPYDVVGAVVASPDATVRDARASFSPNITADLGRRIRELGARASSLAQPPPLDVLTNAGFESVPPPAGRIAGWVYGLNGNGAVALDANLPRGGERSLRVTSTGGVVWTRSDPFEAPATGRLAVWVWLRVADSKNQPPLRLAIEGRMAGKTYYRYAAVGAGAAALGAEWAPFVFHLDDIPATGLTDLRVGFDLMGPGEVWVDDVQLYHLSFDPNEQTELSKIIALASFRLGEGRVGDCAHALAGYWPRFLVEHVPAANARVAADPGLPPLPPVGPAAAPLGPSTAAPDEPKTAEKDPSLLDRLKGYVPKLPKF